MENKVQSLIQLAVGKLSNVRLFRNNVAMAWTGQISQRSGNSITLLNPRPLHAGLTKGSSDLIGWTTVEITPDMVGQKVAVFTAVEVKAGPKSKRTDEQINFVDQLQKSGGIGLFSHTPDDTVNYINSWRP